FAVFYRPEHWVIGMIANNQWSVGGAPGRTSVNFFTAEYVINYNIPGGEGWYLNSSPLVTVNWTAAPGQQWTVPVGGGLGRVFKAVYRPSVRSSKEFSPPIPPTNGPTWSPGVQVALLSPDR